MHTDIDYSESGPSAAINDLIDWYGQEKFDALTRDFKLLEEPISYENFANWISISGVQGYPVKIWHQMIWPKEDTE